MRLILGIVAAAFLIPHALALPKTLEDIDSINFAMGVESFDVASHQPHPPGYPIYIALAKASTAAVGKLAPSLDRDRRAAVGLAVWNVIAGTLAVFVIARLWIAIGLSPALSVFAAAVTVASPLFWLTASRPLSDTIGLVAALLVQTGLVAGRRKFLSDDRELPREWIAGAFAAGLVVGIRSQTMWLTGPLLIWCIAGLIAKRRARDAIRLTGAAAIGMLLWLIPIIWDAGGPRAYLIALHSQGGQDFAGVEMLATTPTLDLLKLSLARTFDAPWLGGTFADVMLGLAVIGFIRLAWRDRRMLTLLAVLFLPYLLFHLAFHETVTIRYALPLLVPVAGLAMIALSIAGQRVAAAGAVAVVLFSIMAAEWRLEVYATKGSPVFHAFQDMQRALPSTGERPVLRMHHQVWWGVRRATDWYRASWDVGPQPFPGDREWLGAVQHWTSGQTTPVWLLADLTRNDVAMFDRRTTTLGGHYETHRGVRGLIGGARLDGLNWWVIDRPAWMLGTGWSVTPEIAGITAADRQGPHQRPAEAYLRRTSQPMRVLIGGRYLSGEGPAIVGVDLEAQPIAQWTVTANPNWFVQWIDLPNGIPDGATPYGTLRVRVSAATDGLPAPWIGLEQFAAAPTDDFLFAFVDGWHEPEANPETGRLWRWTSERSTLLIRNDKGGPLELTLAGESPMRYFDRAPTIVVRAGNRELRRFTPTDDFLEEIAVPAAALQASEGRITIETDQTYAPGEREGTADRRRLGLRMYRVEVHR